jgi:hypothetical protein
MAKVFEAKFCADVEKTLAKGMPLKVWQAGVGATDEEVREWREKNKDFDSAVKVGEARRFEYWYLKMLAGGRGSTTAMKVLEREFGWSKKAGEDLAERTVIVVKTYERGKDETRPKVSIEDL